MKRAVFAGCLAALILLTAPALLLHPQAEKTGSEASQSTAVPAATETSAKLDEPAGYDETHTITVLCAGKPTVMTLADYLAGVVAAEMPASFDDAALEAQAIASRTFALRLKEKPKHKDADVCDDSACCQAYQDSAAAAAKLGDGAAVLLDKVRRVVDATDGEVLTYRGALIEATYFSCSGGATESAAAVWGSDVPYLQSVSSPGEEKCSRYSDETDVPLEKFRSAVLAANPSADLSENPSGWFGAEQKTQGGGVAALTIGGVSFRGTELRTMFGLRSTRFALSIGPESIRFTTYGYGHRVGMSQYGAEAMAKQGSDAKTILLHYYTGAELTKAQ